jgi:hypothetical protein
MIKNIQNILNFSKKKLNFLGTQFAPRSQTVSTSVALEFGDWKVAWKSRRGYFKPKLFSTHLLLKKPKTIAYIINSFMASNNYNIDQKHKNQPEFKKSS